MRRTLLGIDPGVKGCIAICSLDNAVIRCWDFPTLTYRIGRTQKTRLNLPAVFDLMIGISAMWSPELAVVEDVGGLPGQSAPAAFTFGHTTGCQTMALVAAGIPFVKVTPAVWKKALGVPSDKDGARLIAGQLLPNGRALWQRAKDDGRAEAALLALYGQRLLHGSYHTHAKEAEAHAALS